MPSHLENRFNQFLSSLPGSESLDNLLSSAKYDGERRADYLLFNRHVILEIKSLETDPSPKMNTEMDRHRDRDDFPVIFGRVGLDKVLQHLPDGKEINDKIYLRTTRSVEDATKSAEEQISNTAKLLNLPDAVGLLVFLNQNIGVLDPEAVAYRVAMLMRRKSASEAPYPINFAWMIFESHAAIGGPAAKNFPMIALRGPQAQSHPWFEELLVYLENAWAHWNGYALHTANAADMKKFKPVPETPEPKPGDKIRRQDLWRRQYNEKPYLRQLSNQGVFGFGKKAFEAVLPYMQKDGPKATPQDWERVMVPWTHFLTEAEFRGLDMRQMRDA